MSNVRLVQEALAAVLTHTFGCVDIRIRTVTSIAEVQAQLECGLPELAIIDATAEHSSAAATLLIENGLATRLIAFGFDDPERPIAAWSQAGTGGRLSRLPSPSVFQSAPAGRDTARATVSSKRQPSLDHLSQTANGAIRVLTAREEDVARLIMRGESNKEIARLLNISLATVKSHVHNLLAKLGLERRGKLRHYREGCLLEQPSQLRFQADAIVVSSDGHGGRVAPAQWNSPIL